MLAPLQRHKRLYFLSSCIPCVLVHGSGLARGVRWVVRDVGEIWNYFFGGNGNHDKPTEKETIMILEIDPNWDKEESGEENLEN